MFVGMIDMTRRCHVLVAEKSRLEGLTRKTLSRQTMFLSFRLHYNDSRSFHCVLLRSKTLSISYRYPKSQHIYFCALNIHYG